jgi:hypothetical protein
MLPGYAGPGSSYAGAHGMRHYPAYCTDCKRLWLVATENAPSASPSCPRCDDRGRLVPGAYYSDPGSLVFVRLETAIHDSNLTPAALGRMSSELERLLPSPTEQAIDATFERIMGELGIGDELNGKLGKRVTLRMLVTIASTLSQPVVRESGVMRLPQTIPGLFDLVPKKRVAKLDSVQPAEPVREAASDNDSE